MTENPRPGDEQPDFAALFAQFLKDADNPAMAQAMSQMGLDQGNPALMGMLATQLQAMFTAAPTDGVNRELSEDVARKTVATAGDRSIGDAERRQVTEAVHVADLWLGEVTEFEASAAAPAAWSRAEWVAGTMGAWAQVVSPVATGVTGAMGDALSGQLDRFGADETPAIPGLPPGLDLRGMMGSLQPMLARMGTSMFGAQIGQAVGTLAGEVLSATEVGLPLVEKPVIALLPANIATFAEGLDLEVGQVQLYVALREAARTRLFAHVGWLGPQLLAAVDAYGRDITIDTAEIERKVAELDMADPSALQSAMGHSLFSPEPSEAQKAALARLETMLALVEGWVDVVASRAAASRLPQIEALAEAIRRRRASGGPAEKIFGDLVGLQLRPRRLRDAANLFAALEDAGGAALRDAAWGHPDIAPTAADLDDVLGYVERVRDGDQAQSAEFGDLDAELEKLLGGEPGDGAAETK